MNPDYWMRSDRMLVLNLAQAFFAFWMVIEKRAEGFEAEDNFEPRY